MMRLLENDDDLSFASMPLAGPRRDFIPDAALEVPQTLGARQPFTFAPVGVTPTLPRATDVPRVRITPPPSIIDQALVEIQRMLPIDELLVPSSDASPIVDRQVPTDRLPAALPSQVSSWSVWWIVGGALVVGGLLWLLGRSHAHG